ncbi:HAD-like domain-containing protein [Trichoderma longibrachiatum]
MWWHMIILRPSCCIKYTPTTARTRFVSSKGGRLPPRSPPPRRQQPPLSKALRPKARGNPKPLSPPAISPASAAIYFPITSVQDELGAKMSTQSIQIPGLTLLNNLAPHAIAATPDGGLVGAAAKNPQPKTKAPYVPPRKAKKENKKAKARRAQAEAEAAAASHTANANAQFFGLAPAPGQFGFSDFNNHNASFGLNFNHPSNFGLNFPTPNNFGFDMNLFQNNFFKNMTPNNFTATPPFNNAPKNLPRDERVAPSAASGGIPEPTPLYIKTSLSQPVTLRQPRRIFVIMDLNGTLLYRPNKRNPFNFIQRPHARQFLDYCVDTFHVAIWSSARPENVDKMVSQLLSPAQRAKCVVIWGRDRFGLSPADYSSRVQCYKRLSAIWDDPQVRASHPDATQGQRWDQTNTVLVDDSAEKGRSEPYNILQLPEFEGLANEPPDVLPQVHDYLNTLCYQANISSYIRHHPFSIDANYRLPQCQEDNGMA